MKLCLVEDDLLLGRSLKNALENLGHHVLWVRLAADARRFLRSDDFDAALLDLGLPDGEGVAILQELRAANNRVPVIIITARETLEMRLEGFDAGADDYLVKPFDTSELDARLRAILRRTRDNAGHSAALELGTLRMDVAARRVLQEDREVHLSPTEFELLRTLMAAQGRVLTRRQIEAEAMPESEAESLDVHISNLRRKVGANTIRTVRGVGYIMDTET